MDSLFCYEEWPIISSPAIASRSTTWFFSSREEHEAAIRVCMAKELNYMPEKGFVYRIQSDNYLTGARLRAIEWFIKCERRLDLSTATVFVAANCLDRFISLHKCYEWRQWMVDLLSVACLSVASKFTDTTSPSIHEIQMEGLEYSFKVSKIKEMELVLLKALQWKISSATAYSYVELLIHDVDHDSYPTLCRYLTDFLINTLTDVKFLEFRPSIIAIVAMNCTIEALTPLKATSLLGIVTRLTPLLSEADLAKCQMKMKTQLSELNYQIISCEYPSSPVTVLRSRQCTGFHCSDNLSLEKFPRFLANLEHARKKQKTEAQE